MMLRMAANLIISQLMFPRQLVKYAKPWKNYSIMVENPVFEFNNLGLLLYRDKMTNPGYSAKDRSARSVSRIFAAKQCAMQMARLKSFQM